MEKPDNQDGPCDDVLEQYTKYLLKKFINNPDKYIVSNVIPLRKKGITREFIRNHINIVIDFIKGYDFIASLRVGKFRHQYMLYACNDLNNLDDIREMCDKCADEIESGSKIDLIIARKILNLEKINESLKEMSTDYVCLGDPTEEFYKALSHKKLIVYHSVLGLLYGIKTCDIKYFLDVQMYDKDPIKQQYRPGYLMCEKCIADRMAIKN